MGLIVLDSVCLKKHIGKGSSIKVNDEERSENSSLPQKSYMTCYIVGVT